MKKKTKLILTGTLCAGVTVGAISGGVAQIILDNQSELIDLENFDTKIGNDDFKSSEDSSLIENYATEQNDLFSPLGDVKVVNDINSTNSKRTYHELNNTNKKRANFYKNITMSSYDVENHDFNISIDKNSTSEVDYLSNANGDYWNAQMDVWHQINATGYSDVASINLTKDRGSIVQKINKFNSTNFILNDENNIFNKVFKKRNVKKRNYTTFLPSLSFGQNQRNFIDDMTQNIFMCLLSVLPQQNNDDTELCYCDSLKEPKEHFKYSTVLDRSGYLNNLKTFSMWSYYDFSDPSKLTKIKNHKLFGRTFVNNLKTKDILSKFDWHDGEYNFASWGHETNPWSTSNRWDKDADETEKTDWNDRNRNSNIWKREKTTDPANWDNGQWVTGDSIFQGKVHERWDNNLTISNNELQKNGNEILENYFNWILFLEEKVFQDIKKQNNENKKNSFFNKNKKINYISNETLQNYKTDFLESSYQSKEDVDWHHNNKLGRINFEINIANANEIENESNSKINKTTNFSTMVNEYKVADDDTKYGLHDYYGSDDLFFGNRDINKKQRLENIDIDLSDLFIFDTKNSDNYTKNGFDGKIHDSQPIIKLGFNYDLMNALKEAKEISEIVREFVSSNGNMKKTIRNSDDKFNTRKNIITGINNIYNGSFSLKNVKEFVNKPSKLPAINKKEVEYKKILKNYGWEFNDTRKINENVTKDNISKLWNNMEAQLREIINWGFVWDYIIPLTMQNNIYIDVEWNHSQEGKKEKTIKAFDATKGQFSDIKLPNYEGQSFDKNNIVKYKIKNIWMGSDIFKRNDDRKNEIDETQQVVKIGQKSVGGNQTLNLENIINTTIKQNDSETRKTTDKQNPLKNSFAYNDDKTPKTNWKLVNNGENSELDMWFLYNPNTYNFESIDKKEKSLTDWGSSTSEMVDNDDLSKYGYYSELKKRVNTYLNLPNEAKEDYSLNDNDWIEGEMFFGTSNDLDKISVLKNTTVAKESFEKFVNLSEKYKLVKKEFNENKKSEQEFLDAKYELDELGYMYLKIQSKIKLEYYYEIRNKSEYTKWLNDGTLINLPMVNNDTYEYLIKIDNTKKPLKLNNETMESFLGYQEVNWIKEQQDVKQIRDIIILESDKIVEYLQKKVQLKNNLVGKNGLYTQYRNLLKDLNKQIVEEIKGLDSSDPLILKFKQINKSIEAKKNEIEKKYKEFLNSKGNYENNGIHQFVDVKLDLAKENDELISLYNDFLNMFDEILKDDKYGLKNKIEIESIFRKLDDNKEKSKEIIEYAEKLDIEAKEKINYFNDIKKYLEKWLAPSSGGKAEEPLHEINSHLVYFNFNEMENYLKIKKGFVWWNDENESVELGQITNNVKSMFDNNTLIKNMFYLTNDNFINIVNKYLLQKTNGNIQVDKDLFKENEKSNEIESTSKFELFEKNENDKTKYIPMVSINNSIEVYDEIKIGTNQNTRKTQYLGTIVSLINQIKGTKISINKEIGKILDNDYYTIYNKYDENTGKLVSQGYIEKYKNELDSKDWNWRPVLVSEGIDKLIGELNDPKNRNFEYYNERLNVGIVAGVAVAGAVVLIGSIIGIVAIAKRKKHANFVGTGKEEDDIINKFNASNLI